MRHTKTPTTSSRTDTKLLTKNTVISDQPCLDTRNKVAFQGLCQKLGRDGANKAENGRACAADYTGVGHTWGRQVW